MLLGKGQDEISEAAVASGAITLKPGESGHVHLSLTVRHPGPLEEMVTLHTNDTGHPVSYLTDRGAAPQGIAILPQQYGIAMAKGSEVKKEISVEGPLTMEILGVSADQPFVKTQSEMLPPDEIKKLWRVQVTVTKDAPVGPFASTVTIKTNRPERPVITISVSGMVNGDLEVTPPNAFFGVVRKGQARRIELTIRSRSGKLCRVLEAKLLSGRTDQLKVAGIDTGASVQHTFSIELNTDAPRFIDGFLQVRTDVPGEENLRVPVTALISEARD